MPTAFTRVIMAGVRSLRAYFLPALAPENELAGNAVVVIDVLRATTVIAHALAAGARAVIPCLEVDEARYTAAGLPPGQAVLGGERGGLRIDGFDLGNSPSEYHRDSVAGKTVVFTTTNGTKAMRHCRLARRLLLGAFVNAAAVGAAVEAEQDLRLVCAGTRGEITREDVLFAGLIADRLLGAAKTPAGLCDINDQLFIARSAWQEFAAGISGDPIARALATALRSTQGGRNLKQIGLQHDIDAAACLDCLHIVPELDIEAWKITANG